MNDSEPEAEFQERGNKSKAIHPPQYTDCYGGRVLKAVALAETFAKPRGSRGDEAQTHGLNSR
jgi:hypothetical protein